MALKSFLVGSNLARYTAAEISGLISLIASEGVLDTVGSNTDLKVIESGTPAMSVQVGTGYACVSFDDGSETWKVIVHNNAAATLSIAANSSGVNRVDAVVLSLSDDEPNALKTNVASLGVVTGSGATALADAAIDSYFGHTNWVRLADVTVSNGDTTIINSEIADTRALVTLNALPADGDDTYVTLDTNQTGITGDKEWDGDHTFNGLVIFADDEARSTTSAAPTDDKSLANKKYVDDQIEGQIAGLTLVMGEDIDGTTTPKACFISKGTSADDEAPVIRQVAHNGGANYDAYGVNFEGQSFTTDAYTDKIVKVRLCLDKVGAPGGNFIVYLYATDGSGLPTGAALGSVTISAASINAEEFTWYTATFSSPIDVDPNTKYALYGTTISGDASNHIAWHYDNANPYSGGSRIYSSDAGASWNNDTTDDFMFEIWGYESQTAGLVYMSDYDAHFRGLFDGFIEDDLAAAASGQLRVSGIQDGFTGLTAGAMYFVGTTAGSSSTTNDGMQIGMAVSTTEILIDKSDAVVRIASLASTGLQGDTSATRTAPNDEYIYLQCGFKPSRIEIHLYGVVAGANSRIGVFDGMFEDNLWRGRVLLLGTAAAAFTDVVDASGVTSFVITRVGEATLTFSLGELIGAGMTFKIAVAYVGGGTDPVNGSISALIATCYR